VCASYVAIAVASFLLAKPIRDVLFLKQFGAYSLAYAYIGVPLALTVFVPVYNAFAARVGQRIAITGSLLFFVGNVLAFWWAFSHRPAAWLPAAFYVWVSCYGVIAPVQAWSFANTVFDMRQARRLFALVGAGGSVGAILGGFLAQALVRRVGGTVNLLLALAVVILAAAVVVNLGWRVRRRDARVGRRRRPRFADTFGLLRRDRYLTLIAAGVLLVAVVTQWTDVLFKIAANDRLGADPDGFTHFLGEFNFWMGVAALAVQLLFTGPALRKFGIALTIFLLPLALGVGTTLVLIWPVFWTVLVTRGFDQGLRFSVDRATFELLYMPLDAPIKNDVKAAIDLVVSRCADALGGILLLLGTKGLSLVILKIPGLGLGMRGIAAASLVCIGVWLVVANALRRGYVREMWKAVEGKRLTTEATTTPVLDRSAVDALVQKLASPRGDDILFALEQFEAQHGTTLHPAVRGLVLHGDTRVRCRAIELLDARGDRAVVEDVRIQLRATDLETRVTALTYLTNQVKVDPIAVISELGDFPDFSVQASLAAYWVHVGNLDAARILLGTMVRPGVDGRRSRVEAARLLARLPPIFTDVLHRLIEDPDHEVAEAAVASSVQTRDRALVGPLMRRLADPELRDGAVEALAAIGSAGVPRMAAALVTPDTSIEIRRELPLVLARIGTLDAQQTLVACLLEPDAALRFRVIQGLNRLRQLYPNQPLDRQSVIDALDAEIWGHYRLYQNLGVLGRALADDALVLANVRDSIEHEQERIFRLMGLLWPDFDLKSVWVALKSTDRELRAKALELLDAELTPVMRELVVPLFDGQVSVEERIRRANKLFGAEVRREEDAVAALVASEDPQLRATGVYFVGVRGLESLEDEVAKLQGSSDVLLRETVRVALARLEQHRRKPPPGPSAGLPPPAPAPGEDVDLEEAAEWEARHGGSGIG
jgi:AAA family ATP:ADP antiporter